MNESDIRGTIAAICDRLDGAAKCAGPVALVPLVAGLQLIDAGCASDYAAPCEGNCGWHGTYGGAGGVGGAIGTGGDGCSGGEEGTGAAACASGVTESIVHGSEGPSCAAGLLCQGVSCCKTIQLPGGSFLMGRGETGCDASDGDVLGTAFQPEHDATVGSFYLDRFEVTVGRFRTFVAQYDGTAPEDGEGAHPLISGSGWSSAWDFHMPVDQTQLINNTKCDETYQTWTDTAGASESSPMNCVSWYEAFAFCIWDGGRLPTSAEWEYAAAGGSDNRLYPWGQALPGCGQANCGDEGSSPFIPVGTYAGGQGRWGHDDLAGSMLEWTLDYFDLNWYGPGPGNPCDNCANLDPLVYRVSRSSGWRFGPFGLLVTFFSGDHPLGRGDDLGIRCARNGP